MTEKEKMLSGKIYDSTDEELASLRLKAHALSNKFNQMSEDDEERYKVLKELVPNLGEEAYIQGPVQFDYGVFTTIGKRTFVNFNLTVLDTCPITIGDNCFFGPNVSLLTPMHPLRYQDRNTYKKPNGVVTDKEYGKPIVIGDNCWFGGNVTVCGGVTIGEGTVIGAGSVVTKDIPSNCLAAGVPCKVIRQITEEDSLDNHPELF